ncbi:NUDIX hydrolase [Streptomyces sp. 35G-GA-8]|uniref:NUDIX domain-containing protein n=1 Tax=Streptomyces sp. 35G-GA-8 TaxID=2939434 RepID=UPI00201F547D|nr:NUDIX hydrolase [Streptomyces sp. 35G-GA-8]MCL7376992.1 NUDIX hydrolase [Streptomyces sp. 35G-GA-8]
MGRRKAPLAPGICPGGAVGADELPRDAWRREVGEETGQDLRAGRLVALDYVPATQTSAEGDNRVYDGGLVTGETPIALLPDELSAYRFVPREQLHEYLTAHGVRRAHAVLDAVANGTTADLVCGRPADLSTDTPQ